MLSYYKQRRKKLLSQIAENSVVILATNPQQTRSGDTFYPFRPNSNFYYFTSLTEPNALMILSHKEYVIFMQAKDKKAEMWDGERLGLTLGAKTLGAKTKNIKNISEELPKILSNYQKVYFDVANVNAQLLDILTTKEYASLSDKITPLRLIKDDLELANIRKACEISTQAHILAMQQTKNLIAEYEVQSIFEKHFRFHNVEHAYSPIVACGNNANTLHYIDNNQQLNNNDLMLIDAGCEYNYYASDITRTFSISGIFSKEQSEIYNLVLTAQQQAIKAVKIGRTLKQIDKVARDIIANGLIALGIIQTAKQVKRFFPHSIGHFLGLDVHDKGDKKIKLRENMVITIEPGIYLPNNAKISPKYQGIGIRIEDDVLITKTGAKVLTKDCPKTISEIESVIKNEYTTSN
jgi:Xaa-Pro aminopeptidase